MRIACLLMTSFAAWLLVASPAFAQHDAQRNATQDVAAGRFDKAVMVLSKEPQDDPETLFVRMMAELGLGQTEAAVATAEAAMKAGLPFARLVAGPQEQLAPLYQTEAYRGWRKDHADLRLLHGPMLGNVTDSAASFWVRTAEPAEVKIQLYAADGNRDNPAPLATGTAQSTAESDRTAVVRVSGLTASTEYRYTVEVAGQVVEVENARFRTFPTAGKGAKFLVAFGGGAGYIPMWEHMWDELVKQHPLAMLMLGDNVYIDDPTHPLTQHYCYYRRQARDEWRRLTAGTCMFSIYDDHDFGTNDCVPGSEIETPPWKRDVWNRYRQNWVNPSYGGGEKQPGCWYDFYIGDVHFIMLDGRYYRDRKQTPSMLGPVQKAWALKTLKESRGTFKMLVSPVPWAEGIKPGSRDPWDGFPEEREEIFSAIEANRINGVVLISADRHRSDLRITPRPAGYDLVEFESSRLTNRHTHGVVKTEGFIWGYNKTCSAGLMTFDTTAEDPQIKMEVMTIEGERILEYTLPLSKLTFPPKK